MKKDREFWIAMIGIIAGALVEYFLVPFLFSKLMPEKNEDKNDIDDLYRLDGLSK